MNSVRDMDSPLLPVQYEEYTNLKKTKWRFVVLFLLNFTVASVFCCLGSVKPIQIELQQQLNINFTEYNLFTSIYGLPNLVLCFLAGNIIHRIGIHVSNTLFFCIVFVGQVVFNLSLIIDSYTIALLGRLLIGVGGELYQCVNFFIVH